MTHEDEISRRRVASTAAIALAAVVGTLTFSALVGGCQPSIVAPTGSMSAPTIGIATPTIGTVPQTATPSATLKPPSATSAPRGSGSMPTIPAFVPIPSGPVP